MMTDLVTGLPKSTGFIAIAVFVDQVAKMVHFAPCTKELMVPKYAKIFIDTVFQLTGLPKVIVSKWDTKFTNKF